MTTATATATATYSTQDTDIAQATTEIGQAWNACQKPNLDFGKVLYKWRETFSAQGSRTGGGLAQILRKLEINESVAYYWIYRYEVSVGVRTAKEKKVPVIQGSMSEPTVEPVEQEPAVTPAGEPSFEIESPENFDDLPTNPPP